MYIISLPKYLRRRLHETCPSENPLSALCALAAIQVEESEARVAGDSLGKLALQSRSKLTPPSPSLPPSTGVSKMKESKLRRFTAISARTS